MARRPIHDPAEGPLRLIALMSGSGTNVRKVLEHGQRLQEQEGRPIYQVVMIFTDRFDSKASAIGRDHDVPVITHDLSGWLKRHGVARQDLGRREDYDRENLELMRPFSAKVAVYGGYMSIASPSLVRAYLGINVHPADLSVKAPDGKRKWTGAHAVRDAIAAGEKFIRSSTHVVSEVVDMGPLLMISAPLTVEVPPGADLADPRTLQAVADANQERLKAAGDWVIFPRSLEAIARGAFELDDEGKLYYQGRPAPEGLKLE